MERTRKGRAEIDAVLAAPDDDEPPSPLPDDTPVGYPPPMSLPDMDGRVAICTTVQTYTRVLLEAQRRRKSPDQTTDELVNEALDRILAEIQSLGMHHSLTPIEPPAPDPNNLAAFKRAHIIRVLERCDGNISEAARQLGMHRQSLQRKMKALYIEPTKPEPELVPYVAHPHEHCDHEGNTGIANCTAVQLFVQPDKPSDDVVEEARAELREIASLFVPSPRAPCDYRDGACPNTLKWRGRLRCGCPRPSRSAA